MVNKTYERMLNSKSQIRILSEYCTKRCSEIGKENVFDFTIGNPSVQLPQEITNSLIDELNSSNPLDLHSYTPTLGNPDFKKAVAESLNMRFNMNYSAEHIFPSIGAQGAIAVTSRVVIANPEDEIVIIAPYFSEYFPYLQNVGAKIVVVPADTDSFQINFSELEKRLTHNTAAIMINTPNNPSGVVYSDATLRSLADLLRRKSNENGRNIFLISDEPYREIIYGMKSAPYASSYYEHSISCYSFSKSYAIPGERIGYAAVNPNCECADTFVPMCGQVSRTIGHNGAPSIFQIVLSHNMNLPINIQPYQTNMELLYNCFLSVGISCVKPEGTFYMFPKSLEEDAKAFCEKARKYELVFVPGDDFGVPGYFRVAYCIETEKVERSIPIIRRFVKEEYGIET